ncbi:2-isopropylmalate synthase [Anaeroplasma bactoclasticum]|jgi:2-isopropylmalate synthase|uniref:2-isopropylmalate synthase n=1 Tax=Anaeroplasma bactoclasticum TaxID=2088 RepID=A0A397S0T7_9MOLU|nr:2-isopropylmalate synthase [Anaeroplasma bactoclasticum]RIA75804.1 2-isopropylmalate synthase [Anaeroplasma bactoclasticum]
MKGYEKYFRGYFMPPVPCYDWVKKEYIDKAPIWCSVDLRDGNQSLIKPMSLDQKVEFFKLLVQIGFKEIEVGFPAASETEYEFLRTLIDGDLIPDDVTIQVLTQARPHIIKKTFKALEGCKKAIVHLYNSTSLAQREQVFKKSKEEIKEIAVEGAKMLVELAKEAKGDIYYEYSPESFTGTEPDYALEVCNAVIDVFKPTPNHKLIINLPATVEMSLPHVYASQIEYMSKYMNKRDSVIISLHPHNDRGTGVADAELGLLAGADRIEGTLFGNGERTGNVDVITLALNMYTHGINPILDFSNLPDIIKLYESVTEMKVYDRQPYAGKFVFAAFSGSHQDAISKGLKYHKANKLDTWSVPYLPLDPKDVSREYSADVIRINSQSGKGGIAYILETNFGLNIPPKMRETVGYTVKDVSDKEHKELTPSDVQTIFVENFVNLKTPLKMLEYHFIREGDLFKVMISTEWNGVRKDYLAEGSGRLDAVSNAIKECYNLDYVLTNYNEHALESTSKSEAAAFVSVKFNDKETWGSGIHEDIICASIYALVSAINNQYK